MKIHEHYLKGKSVFIVSLLVTSITILTVYLTGINFNRSMTSNLYISLSIIASVLFIFITYGLYQGIGLIDDFPKFKWFKLRGFMTKTSPTFDLPNVDVGDGIAGIILSILLWLGMSILFIVLLLLFEVVFWFSIFILLAMLYWIFFRALKLVFSTSKKTKGNLEKSLFYAFNYTLLYSGWLFAITYLTTLLK